MIAALLKDTLRRALEIPELAPIVGRMEVREENSLTALPQMTESPDVILLDPMFPERQKSALIKKKFQLLQQLESPCAEEDALVHAAMEAAQKEEVQQLNKKQKDLKAELRKKQKQAEVLNRQIEKQIAEEIARAEAEARAAREKAERAAREQAAKNKAKEESGAVKRNEPIREERVAATKGT